MKTDIVTSWPAGSKSALKHSWKIFPENRNICCDIGPSFKRLHLPQDDENHSSYIEKANVVNPAPLWKKNCFAWKIYKPSRILNYRCYWSLLLGSNTIGNRLVEGKTGIETGICSMNAHFFNWNWVLQLETWSTSVPSSILFIQRWQAAIALQKIVLGFKVVNQRPVLVILSSQIQTALRRLEIEKMISPQLYPKDVSNIMIVLLALYCKMPQSSDSYIT